MVCCWTVRLDSWMPWFSFSNASICLRSLSLLSARYFVICSPLSLKQSLHLPCYRRRRIPLEGVPRLVPHPLTTRPSSSTYSSSTGRLLRCQPLLGHYLAVLVEDGLEMSPNWSTARRVIWRSPLVDSPPSADSPPCWASCVSGTPAGLPRRLRFFGGSSRRLPYPPAFGPLSDPWPCPAPHLLAPACPALSAASPAPSPISWAACPAPCAYFLRGLAGTLSDVLDRDPAPEPTSSTASPVLSTASPAPEPTSSTAEPAPEPTSSTAWFAPLPRNRRRLRRRLRPRNRRPRQRLPRQTPRPEPMSSTA